METEINVKRESKGSHIKALFLYLFIFYLVWAFKELWLVKYIYLYDETTSALLMAIIKIFVWIVPTCLWIKYYLHINPINYLKMNVHVKRGLFWGVVLSLILGLRFAFEVYILHHQRFHFDLSLTSYLNVFLLSGITEEIVFRGFILQEIGKKMSFWKANLITAFLFLVIHYAVWMYDGIFFDVWSHLYVYLLGLIFGFVYKKTGSLWSVVLLHSFHNLLIMISF
ncbi:membrane protease YdiL (CAAX protease family) [Oikeobacillus pervagus]|uniref:Membrane protease YdiL (CAAX protease family) n=1 Tax=Oikeobacillus pervagus TaxID=1325931 RepID=A0AAJ1WKK5_9BACI|nr:type II CAAX endopeptidase family protein [Oikeobacillus pervagus]MDQ0216703.1 membrane protease YdiL (CAAX protease family) [Oikeobacillus pervagus]